MQTDVKSYLNEISERLWTQHASIIIGAGFSKNAINTINPDKMPPDWNQLGDLLLEKLYGEIPSHAVRYGNILKLAEEFESAFGRSALDHFIQKSVADNEYQPSELHKRIMELPWSDVFTTNYDTLLERSCKDVLSRKYDIVVNQDDLVYSNRPRVIKLHGSFPSERPLIITEEDYRTYPIKNAPFVNTVQQSLLENTLCLVGFSGDDPNFLQWVGWINDRFGHSYAPKIYLIGVLNLSESKKKLLYRKNIIPVDLSQCSNVNGDHRKGIEFFVEFLQKQEERLENRNWPMPEDGYRLAKDDDAGVKELIERWGKVRHQYPNWLILPQEQREILWRNTKSDSNRVTIFESLQQFQDLQYVYELNWRLERCLVPIWTDMAPYFQDVLDRYNFFPSDLIGPRLIQIDTYEKTGINWKKYTRYWVELSISMLRYYREENQKAKWEENHNILDALQQHLTHDQLAALHYEKVLYYLFELNHTEAKKMLDKWPQNNNSLRWEVKRAMMMCEFGQYKESVNLLENILIEIRRKMNLSPVENDYHWVSQEAYVMFQLKMVKRNFIGSIKIGLDEISDQHFNERWNDLLRYRCDPWGEKKYFEIVLRQEYRPEHPVTIKDEFRIGRRSKTYSSAESLDVLTAYSFFRYLEELAIPLSISMEGIDVKTIKGALQRIKMAAPNWALSILNRFKNNSSVEAVFDRYFLNTLSVSQVDSYIDNYLNSFERLFADRKTDPIAKTFIANLPNILCYLASKCSEGKRLMIFKLYAKLLEDLDYRRDLKKLLISLIDSSNCSTITSAAEILLSSPIMESQLTLSAYKVEAFEHIDSADIRGKIHVSAETINLLFISARKQETKSSAIRRLVFLKKINRLNLSNQRKLHAIIWEETNNNGFPKQDIYFYATYLHTLKPPAIDVVSLYKTYILQHTFEIQGLNTEKNISLGRGRDRYVFELINGFQTKNRPQGIKWSRIELELILGKCEEWWSLDKHYLVEDKYKHIGFGGSIHEEFNLRFRNLSSIIARFFGHHLTELNDHMKNRLIAMVNELDDHGISVLKAKAVFGLFIDYTDYLNQVTKVLSSKNEDAVYIDALESMLLSVSYGPFKKDRKFVATLLDTLSIPLQWHILPLVGDIFDTLNELSCYHGIDLSPIRKVLHIALEKALTPTDENITMSRFLLTKQKAVLFAGNLYRKLLKNNKEIWEILGIYKDMVDAGEEFGDVINYWDKG